MLTLMIEVRALPGKEDAVVEELSWFATEVRKEAGNSSYDFFRSAGDPTRFLVVEEFVDMAAREAHRNSEHEAAARVRMRPLLAENPRAVVVPAESWFRALPEDQWVR